MKTSLQTFKFFMNRVYQLKPSLIGLQLLFSALRTIEMLLVLYIPSILIFFLEAQSTQLLVSIYLLAGLFGIWLIRLSCRILSQKIALHQEQFSQALMKEISYKITTTAFNKIEDTDFVAKKEEALFPIVTQGAVQVMFNTIPTILQALFILLSALAILLVYEPLIMPFAFIVPITSFIISRKLIAQETEEAKKSARKNSEYVYYLRKMHDANIAKDVRVYQMQTFFAAKYKELFDIIVGNIKKFYASREYRALINQALSTLLLIAIYTFLIIRVFNTTFDAAIFVLLINATINFNDQMSRFFSEILLFNQQLIYLSSLKDFYAMFEDSDSKGTMPLNHPIESVEFRNVTFRYPSSTQDVLNNCSFKIDNNQNLSIVGRNGSGKTTIIKLLSRLYTPQSGDILVNGVDINKYEEGSYLTQLSIIFQDFKTFQYSMRENIAFDKNYGEEVMNYALKQSEFELELSKFPNGINTNLVRDDKDHQSVSLSKGQEQKLVIARSIYNDGSLLILDEPTASLDPIAEEEVYKHFQTITKDKLAIFISHRLSSCRFSDMIIYLDEGCVKETGTHHALMQSGGLYATLFGIQASKYREEVKE